MFTARWGKDASGPQLVPGPSSLGGQLGVLEMGPRVVCVETGVPYKAWLAEQGFSVIPHVLISFCWPCIAHWCWSSCHLYRSSLWSFYDLGIQCSAWNICHSEATPLDEDWPDLVVVWTMSSSENWMRWIFSENYQSQTLWANVITASYCTSWSLMRHLMFREWVISVTECWGLFKLLWAFLSSRYAIV